VGSFETQPYARSSSLCLAPRTPPLSPSSTRPAACTLVVWPDKQGEHGAPFFLYFNPQLTCPCRLRHWDVCDTPCCLPHPAHQESTHKESANHPLGHWGEDENTVPGCASSGDPREVLGGIFVDSPPPVLLSLGGSEQEYYLFDRPAHKPPAANDEGDTDDVLLATLHSGMASFFVGT